MERLAGLAPRSLACARVGPAAVGSRPCAHKVIRFQRITCAAAETTVSEETSVKADKPQTDRQNGSRRDDSRPRAALKRDDASTAAHSGETAPAESVEDNTSRNANGGNPNPPTAKRLSGGDRELIRTRTRSLLAGEAVGLSISPTPADLAAGMRGLRPLSQGLARQERTILFFPSLEAPRQETAAGVEGAQGSAGNGSGKPERRQRTLEKKRSGNSEPRAINLALVAVPQFEAPKPEVTIKVGAKSDAFSCSRALTRALLQSSSVAVQSAGPAAALVAMQAAVQSRRDLAAQEQLDLAFSIEYLNLSPAPAEATSPPTPEATSEAAAATAAGVAAEAVAPAADPAPTSADAAAAPVAAGAPTDAAAGSSGAAARPALNSVLQFSFYKRVLPTPEVAVAEFASTRATSTLAEVLTRLMGERRCVELLVRSGDSFFAMQAVSRVVSGCWSRYGASVGLFLTSLEYDAPAAATADVPPSSPADASAPAAAEGVREGVPQQPRFTARLQLRRIPGAPNLVAASGFGSTRQSLLGPPLGTVRWNTPVAGLGSAINKEIDSVGAYSLFPEEGLCVARTLAALWEAQSVRGARPTRAAPATATADSAAPAATGDSAAPAAATADSTPADGDSASAATAAIATAAAAPAAEGTEIAIVPEAQFEGGGSTAAATAAGGSSRRRRDGSGGSGGGSREGPARATVLHLVEVTPVLARTLAVKEGTKVPVADGSQLRQFMKAVLLRNRMYGNKPQGKLLVMEPFLDSSRALNLLFDYIDTATLDSLPLPPATERVAVAGGRARRSSSTGTGSSGSSGAKASSTAAPSVADAVAAARAAAMLPPADGYISDACDGYATDDEFGIGAEAAVLVPTAQAGRAAGGGGSSSSSTRGPLLLPASALASDGYETDDEFGVGAEAAVFMQPQPAAEAAAEVAAEAATAAAAAAAGPGKSAWILYVNAETNTQQLAMDIVDEAVKPYDRLSPVWLRVRCWPKPLANALVAVAQAQLQVQERAEVQLQVLPVLDRLRDDQNRPNNGLTLQLVKQGPGAEPGAAVRLADKWKAQQAAAAAEARTSKDGRRPRPGPSPAAMAAAAAAAAKLVAKDSERLAGNRKMW